ncbi:fatty acid synthase-like [Cylas formicarius]|uniref:fatty acid synthase-like n=1 Tax=Cylas formicarius TaxID=197179 RepID=UPI0029589F7F|nr:fatty acid synthase-like [Cylas formicarius]
MASRFAVRTVVTDESGNEDSSIKIGRILANPSPGEEVVIAGLSGIYPDSNDVHHFRDNLFNKIDMISGDCRRWEPTHPEIPQRTGKVYNIEKYDAGYFGVHHRQATCMDPMCRLLLERVVEAIFDAGLNPSDLEGTNTGVFIGSCFSENEKTWFFEKLSPQTPAIMGTERSMLSNRISYFLKLKGPSYICDTACSSSLFAFEHAYKAIRTGECENAIVCGTNVCLHPYLSLQFARLGVLSPEGNCRPFDEAGNGYVRSEAIVAILLQKSKVCKRIYATVLHAKTNSDGYKDSGITFPSREMQKNLMHELYEEYDAIKPSELSFLEAHGTGTKVGDPEELQAIEEVFLNDRKTPLLIGSVKSNIGHSEATSGLCSITKVIIAMETGFIPPNINYEVPRQGIKSLEEGRLKVITQKTPFQDSRGLIGVNSFGFGGSNCHVLLRHNAKIKQAAGRSKNDIPRLVCVSGRTENSVTTLLEDVKENGFDVEHIGLLHNIFRKRVGNHFYRGYSLVSRTEEITRSIRFNAERKWPLVLAFGEMNLSKQQHASFLKLPIFAATLQRISGTLSPLGINVVDVFVNIHQPDSLRDSIIRNLVTQLAVADILRELEIEPARVFGASLGLSLGTLACAYFDKAVTLKEVMECALAIVNAAILAANEIKGAAVIEDLGSLISKTTKIAINLSQELTSILRKPRRFSDKVIPDSSEFSSAYIMMSLGSKKVLSDVKTMIEGQTTVAEIGNGVLSQCIKNDASKKRDTHLMSMSGGLKEFLCLIGSLYEMGHNPQIQNLYPKIEFPVSRGTPMIAPKIKWEHGRNWWVSLYTSEGNHQIEENTVAVMTADPSFTYMEGHIIDGRNLFPATGYLELVWDTLAQIHGLLLLDTKIAFENCKFKRACPIPKESYKLELIVMVQKGSGKFEVMEGGAVVVSGKVTKDPNDDLHPIPCSARVGAHVMPDLTSKDIYKELRLRGYNYKGAFASLDNCDNGCQVAEIPWDGNWVNFIDNMLQMKILQEDTRLLYVPTRIGRMLVDPRRHLAIVKSYGENPKLPVYISKEADIIRSGGIEIRGLNASAVPRKKYLGTPVLEKYVFVPNVRDMELHQAIRTNMQILLENTFSIRVKVVELIDESSNVDSKPLGDMVHDVLADQPLIQPDITILAKGMLEMKNVKVEDKKLLTETECSLVIGSKILQRPKILQLAFGSIKEHAFILSREPIDYDPWTSINPMVTIVTVFTTKEERLIFFRKAIQFVRPSAVRISDEERLGWLSQLQACIKKDGNVLAYAQGEPSSGILGLVNCTRREPGGQNVKCVFVVDEAPEFDLDDNFYVDQLSKNLAVNVFKDGQWGTYRHLLLERSHVIEAEHCYLTQSIRGDLSSFRWTEGNLRVDSQLQSNEKLVSVYYASLNFRDVMTAAGKISVDVISRDRREQDCVQGLEFAGRTMDGRRVMGLVYKGALSTLIVGDTYLLWPVPDHWTLEDAVTVPVVYSTCLYALRIGGLTKGDSILIHSGTGGIGQAAIALALHIGCTVYTTVGTREKRDFLKKRFPQLTDKHIYSSRDTNFENQIMKATGGKGVNVVLNSLAEEMLLASVRCLARGGRFMEIGKFDLANDNPLNLLLFQKQASFHGFMLDDFFRLTPDVKRQFHEVFQEALNSGAIQPLKKNIFKMDEVEQAFRFMASGKHIGKVMMQIKKEENEKVVKPVIGKFPGLPRYYCDEQKSYIICGGLGGFGLELADWLALRGCRKLILTSRHGVRTGYQGYRISIWKSYGCTVEISTENITTLEGCTAVIKKANELGPVHAIFNLAVVLKDSILENQDEKSFKVPFGAKACATANLDAASRELCPQLRDFVVFSSVSCGRGNAGQTNYGMANSIMERLCEKRRSDGYPALAIEWGAVGEVGLVAEMQKEHTEIAIGGTLQQRISSCLQVLDVLLRQNEAAVVSSMVVAEKRAGFGAGDNILDAVASILGIQDLKAISFQATLAEVGMDSMTAVEIKQTLETEFEVFLTAQDIKSMTFARLQEIQLEKTAELATGSKTKALMGMDMILRISVEQESVNLPLVSMRKCADSLRTVVLFPGVEGIISVLKPLYTNLDADILGLQFCNYNQADTIEGMAGAILPIIEERMPKQRPFNIVAYSFGAVVALEVVSLLEKKGYCGSMVSIDGAPDQLKKLTKILEVESDDRFQTSLLIHLMCLIIPFDRISKHVEALYKCSNFEERLKLGEAIVGNKALHSPEHQKASTISLYKRIKALVMYEPDFKLKSRVTLLKPTHSSIEMDSEDYGLSKVCEHPVELKMFEGNHVTILENPEVWQAINHIVGGGVTEVGTKEEELLVHADAVSDEAKENNLC